MAGLSGDSLQFAYQATFIFSSPDLKIESGHCIARLRGTGLY